MDILTRSLYDAVIIGAGPAGIMAAITASRRNRRVILLEKMPSVARKLLISGKGRCNLTNSGNIDKFLEKFSPSGVFLRNAFSRFFNDDLIAFFEESSCPLKTERGGRVFPLSDSSADILNALKQHLEKNNVKIARDEEVVDIYIEKYGIKCVAAKSGRKYYAMSVAVCTGGLFYPLTGSTGFGFSMAKNMGHNVIAASPGLVGVVVKSVMPRNLEGLSLENVSCAVHTGGKIIDSRQGDMIFTYSGLSGPVILDLSGLIYDLLQKDKQVFVSINLKPGLDIKKLDARLQREFLEQPLKILKNILIQLLPARLVPEFLKYCALNPAKKANQITKDERKKLMESLFDFRFEIVRTGPIKDAIITRGGVSTRQINPKTMESRVIKGVYFAGEVIDVDAKTGGYNMQAAFSTGYVCGENL